MEEAEFSKKCKKGITDIIAVQLIFTAVIIASVLSVKYIFKDTYSELKQWYTSLACDETDVNEVLEAFEKL